MISASPDEGQRWHRDEPVRLVVSLGQELAEVPAGLVGMREEDARAALQGVGLTEIEVSREYTNDAPRNEVIWASVRDGDMVPTDERVRLTVSDGPPPVTVPDVAGDGRRRRHRRAGRRGTSRWRGRTRSTRR